MKKKWINLLIVCFITSHCFAQTDGYKFFCRLDSIKKAGFYNILLEPQLSAHLKTDYSDVRIVTNSGKWVPHILHIPAGKWAVHSVLFDLKYIISENSGFATTLLVENRQDTVSNIGLVITNTAAERFCTLSGSSDKQNWFVINDSIPVKSLPDENSTKTTFMISFPPNDYRFYKIDIHNNGKAPFNIKGVVQDAIPNIPDPLIIPVQNPATTLEQKDSGKVSYIRITQPETYQFNKVSIKLKGIKYFYRDAELYIPEGNDNSFSNPGHQLKSITLSNNNTLQFNVPLSKTRVFYLLIMNEDNLPLTVTEVSTFSYLHYISTYLEPGGGYRLLLDNEAAQAPNYDLSKLNVPTDSASFLQPGKPVATEEIVTVASELKNTKWMIWVVIGIALAVLLYFCFKMLGEVDKRKKHDHI